jgi:ATP-dependent RNA helicase RhlB
VAAGLADAGFDRCTPIQAQSLPLALAGQDVAGQAQTGTGKTAAFLVAILTKLLRLPQRDPHFPSALIVAPTRELALQIYADAQVIGGHAGLSLAQVVGGIDYVRQAEVLRQGADIVICTPGRIIDYLKQGVFKTSGIKALVIDEADRLFDLGFTKDMRYILRRLPHYEKRQSMLFSVTLSHRVLELTYEYMNLPKVIRVAAESLTVEGVEQSLFHVGKKEKLSLLLGLLERDRKSVV